MGFDGEARKCLSTFYLLGSPPSWVDPFPEIWRDLLLLERPTSPRNGSPIEDEETLVLLPVVRLIGPTFVEGGS